MENTETKSEGPMCNYKQTHKMFNRANKISKKYYLVKKCHVIDHHMCSHYAFSNIEWKYETLLAFMKVYLASARKESFFERFYLNIVFNIFLPEARKLISVLMMLAFWGFRKKYIKKYDLLGKKLEKAPYVARPLTKNHITYMRPYIRIYRVLLCASHIGWK